MKIRWLLFFLFAWVTLHAQGIQDWRTITYMNDITDMVLWGDEIWVSTSGGVYNFIPEDSTYKAFTNIEGLGSIDLTSIETDIYERVIASSRDGLINRYDRDFDLWEVYGNLEGEVIVDLYTIEDTLWVATNTGVGVFLLSEDHIEFRDFYNNFAVMVDKANRICVYNDRVFYATEYGLLHAPSNFIKNNLKISEAWELITVDEGLPSSTILDIVPTTDSLLVGTSSGATSIDENNVLSEIYSWDKGRVSRIVISDSEIYFVNGRASYKQIENVWTLINVENTEITSGVIDDFSNLWIGIEKGGLKRSDWNSSFLVDGPASNHIGSLLKDGSGELWISSGKYRAGTGEGFYHYDFDHWTNYKYYNNDWYRKNNVVTVYEDQTGKIWYGAWGGGIAILDDNNIEYIHGWLGDGRLEITTNDSKNEVIATEPEPEMASCLSPAQVSLDDYLVSPYFIEDDNGYLWCTSSEAEDENYLAVIPRNENGDLNFNCSHWTYFGRNIGFSKDEGQISVLEYDDFNRLWIGTFTLGILVFDYNGTVENRSDDQPLIRVSTSTYPSLFSNKILSLKRDQDGIMWIGTAGGLNSFDGQNFYKHVGDIGPIENKINAIFVDSFNNKWFATDGGLSILKADESPWNAESWLHYTPDNSGLPNKIVNSIFVDQNKGETYIGTESGLSIFTGSFSELKKDLSSVVSGPSPFILDDNTDFVIKNLVFGASVKILNVNGRLVRTLSSENGNIEGGRATWDGRNQSMDKVSSGVYIYLIYNEEGITASGKIAVVKP